MFPFFNIFFDNQIVDVPGQRSLSQDFAGALVLRDRDGGTKGLWDKETCLSRDKGTTGCPISWKTYFKSHFMHQKISQVFTYCISLNNVWGH